MLAHSFYQTSSALWKHVLTKYLELLSNAPLSDTCLSVSEHRHYTHVSLTSFCTTYSENVFRKQNFSEKQTNFDVEDLMNWTAQMQKGQRQGISAYVFAIPIMTPGSLKGIYIFQTLLYICTLQLISVRVLTYIFCAIV